MVSKARGKEGKGRGESGKGKGREGREGKGEEG